MRSVMAVVTTQSVPITMARTMAPRARRPRSAASEWPPPMPPSIELATMNTPPASSQVHSAAEAARGNARVLAPTCSGTT